MVWITGKNKDKIDEVSFFKFKQKGQKVVVQVVV
jgi:hypothetical protein